MRDHKVREILRSVHLHNTPEYSQHIQDKLQQFKLSLPELYYEIEIHNQLVEVFRNEGYPNSGTKIHCHRFFEIIFCRSSNCMEYLIGSNRYQIQKGDILIIPPGIIHAAIPIPTATNNYKGDVLWLTDTFFRDLSERYPYFHDYDELKGTMLRTTGTVWENLEVHFSVAIEEANIKAPGWESAVMGQVILIMTHIYRAIKESNPDTAAPEERELFDRIVAYVDTFLAQKITLEDTANRFWVSQSTVTQAFNDKLGTSFYKYVMQRRLTEAANLILCGIPMEQIYTKVGYNDYSAFYRAFKREYGISPKEFRRLKLE